MTPREKLLADLAALDRPRCPLFATPTSAAHLMWRAQLGAWVLANPDGNDRYEALLRALGELEEAEARARADRERLRSWGERHVPRLIAAALASVRDTQALQMAGAWLNQPKPWLVLLGAPGTGKSVAAAWALRRCFENGDTVAWQSAATIATRAGGFNGEELATRLRGVDVLAVDDLGAEHDSDWGRSVLREVLQSRHDDGLRTIVTSNLFGAEFRGHIGTRLADRVRGQCLAAELRGKSLREGATS
jgi:DNA replication protein DnaC